MFSSNGTMGFAEKRNVNIDNLLQLHEDIQIIYVVDGYEALFLNQNGMRGVRTCKAKSVREAFEGLCEIMEQDFKTLEDVRLCKDNKEIVRSEL